MGNKVKNYIGNTFEIFENTDAGFFQKYKPTKGAVDRVFAKIFMRYAKNDNPITMPEAESMVNDIISQVRKMDPKKIPYLLSHIKIYLNQLTMHLL